MVNFANPEEELARYRERLREIREELSSLEGDAVSDDETLRLAAQYHAAGVNVGSAASKCVTPFADRLARRRRIVALEEEYRQSGDAVLCLYEVMGDEERAKSRGAAVLTSSRPWWAFWRRGA